MIFLLVSACLISDPSHCKDFEIQTEFKNSHQCMLFNQQILAKEFQTPALSKWRATKIKCERRTGDERDA
jgi:hypothetical protein